MRICCVPCCDYLLCKLMTEQFESGIETVWCATYVCEVCLHLIGITNNSATNTETVIFSFPPLSALPSPETPLLPRSASWMEWCFVSGGSKAVWKQSTVSPASLTVCNRNQLPQKPSNNLLQPSAQQSVSSSSCETYIIYQKRKKKCWVMFNSHLSHSVLAPDLHT